MGWRFQRRIKIFPGVTLNFSKSGMSVSIGFRGFHYTFGGKRGGRITAGLPGTGVSYTRELGEGKEEGERSQESGDRSKE